VLGITGAIGAPGGFAARPSNFGMCSNAFSVSFPKFIVDTIVGLFCKMKTMSEAVWRRKSSVVISLWKFYFLGEN